MSDPVPAIAEASATGALAEIFADIAKMVVICALLRMATRP